MENLIFEINVDVMLYICLSKIKGWNRYFHAFILLFFAFGGKIALLRRRKQVLQFLGKDREGQFQAKMNFENDLLNNTRLFTHTLAIFKVLGYAISYCLQLHIRSNSILKFILQSNSRLPHKFCNERQFVIYLM